MRKVILTLLSTILLYFLIDGSARLLGVLLKVIPELVFAFLFIILVLCILGYLLNKVLVYLYYLRHNHSKTAFQQAQK